MAGAFTHFLICDAIKKRKSLVGRDLLMLASRHAEFAFLGAASPDLPYLSFKTGSVNWADVMHYEKTNSIVLSGHSELKGVWHSRSPGDEVKFVWLLGFVSHLVADATIHPIVQAIVGPYDVKENQKEHRICEMTQDSLLFNEYKKEDIRYADFSEILEFCGESEYFDDLMEFCKAQVIKNYGDKGEEPHPSLWFDTYTEAIGMAESERGVGAVFRHLGVGTDYFYKPKAEILSNYPEYYKKYYEKVILPSGNGSFREVGFERAIRNVATAWNSLYAGVKSDLLVAGVVKNWNLDTGVDMDSANKEVTFQV